MLTAVLPARLEDDVVHAAGANRLDRSIVEGGSGGIRCGGSRMSSRTGIGELEVTYQIRLPIPMFGVPPVTCREKMRIKAWVGYEKPGFEKDDEKTVYVTETGLVYHKDYHCTYLELSIHMVQPEEVEGLRNTGGGKYYPCDGCLKKNAAPETVWVTKSGTHYHASRDCGKIKRTVKKIPLSEASMYRPCSRCAKGE